MEDQLVVKLFNDRSEEAIEATSKKYGKLCTSISRNILNNSEDAEECVNDTYLALWNSILFRRILILTIWNRDLRMLIR